MPWTWFKLKRMTFGPSWPVRPFTVGYFYLKDLTWSDNDNNMYLGPVVAAQQVLDPSPSDQVSSERKEGGGGYIRYNQVFRSLIPGSRYRFTSQDVTGKVIFMSADLSVGWGHGGRVVTLSPPTSEAGVRSPSWPQVGKLVVACRWSAVYSTDP